MCGIVAYHGVAPASSVLMNGLARLEYRGYDSVGIGLHPGGNWPLRIYRSAGRLPGTAPTKAPGPHPPGLIGSERQARTQSVAHGRRTRGP